MKNSKENVVEKKSVERLVKDKVYKCRLNKKTCEDFKDNTCISKYGCLLKY